MSRKGEVGWQERAACKDIGASFFTSFLYPDDVEKAKAICNKCPVREPCLVYQFDSPWIAGGFTKYERLCKIWNRIESEEENNFDY